MFRKYAPNAGRAEYLEPGIHECLKAQNKCNVNSPELRQTRRDRVGHFFLDIVNFKRRTVVTGWHFETIIVVVVDRIVHKSWSGVPAISEVEENLNPLGPLQERITSPSN